MNRCHKTALNSHTASVTDTRRSQWRGSCYKVVSQGNKEKLWESSSPLGSRDRAKYLRKWNP